MRAHVTNLLRLAKLPATASIKRLIRLGKWDSMKAGCGRAGRPVLVEFANPRSRDTFLAAAGKMQSRTKGIMRVGPDEGTFGKQSGWRKSTPNHLDFPHLRQPVVKIPRVQWTPQNSPQNKFCASTPERQTKPHINEGGHSNRGPPRNDLSTSCPKIDGVGRRNGTIRRTSEPFPIPVPKNGPMAREGALASRAE